MMSDLVSNHVSLCKVSGRFVSLSQFVEEDRIDVHLGIAGAIKRAHGRTAHAAGRTHASSIDFQFWRCITPALNLLAEQLRPDILGAFQNASDEDLGFIIDALTWLGRGLGSSLLQCFGGTNGQPLLILVNAHEVHDDHHDNQQYSPTAGSHGGSATTSAVNDVFTFLVSIKSHGSVLYR